MKLFIRNLAWEAREDDIRQLLDQNNIEGEVILPRDRRTGKARGFAFVKIEGQEKALLFMAKAKNATVAGRNIDVSESRDDRASRPRRDEPENERRD